MTERRVVGIYRNDYLKNYVSLELKKIEDKGINTEFVEADDTFYDERFGITRFPVFLFMKDDSLVCKINGKYMDDTLIKQLESLKWI